jgi:tight adherence protein B
VIVIVPMLVFATLMAAALAAEVLRREAVRERVRRASPQRVRREVDVRRLWTPAVLAISGFAAWRAVGALVALVAWLGARSVGGRRSRRTTAAIRDEQLGDAVGALTSAIRAGLSVPQALAYAAREAEPPLAEDLGALVASLDAGVPAATAVTAWTDRVGTDDARLLGSVLELHRKNGGDLPAVLDQVAGAIRERVAASREVRALTAQARLSGLILGLLPIGFFAFLWLTSRREIEGALATTAGIASIAIGLVLEIGAFVWIRRLLEVA